MTFPDHVRLVFDLDDTLHSEREFAISGFRAASAWASENLDIHGLDADMVRLLDQGHLGAVFELALRNRKPGATVAEIAALQTAYRTHLPEIAVYDDVNPVLDVIETPIGLITDGSAHMQRRKVEALGLTRRFAEIVYTDALGSGRQFFKPHPRAFEVIQERLGGDGVAFVYVGDNPSKDFVAPNALGWTSVMIERPLRIHAKADIRPDGAPHAVIRSLSELAGVVKA